MATEPKLEQWMENEPKLEWWYGVGPLIGIDYWYTEIAMLDIVVCAPPPGIFNFRIEGDKTQPAYDGGPFKTLNECQLAAEAQLLKMFKEAVKELEGVDGDN